MWMLGTAVVLVTLGVTGSEAKRNFIDLSYAFNNETVMFPGRVPSFNIELEGFTAAGFWVASKGFCTSEHTSTHIDAPYHFNKNGRTLDQIPIDDLIDIPGVMIDMYDKVHHYENGRFNLVENYALTREDIIQWEKVNGRIPDRSVVLVRSGWGIRWPDASQYLGLGLENGQNSPPPPPTRPPPRSQSSRKSEGPSSTLDFDTKLNFPGFSAGAASYLVTERNCLGVGIDALSIDVGSNKLFPAHQIFAARNVYMIENVANLHLLPPKGFNLWMLPFKIDQGTGAPLRIIASVAHASI